MPSEPPFGRHLIFASLTCLIDAVCKKRYHNQNVYILSILRMTRSKPVNRTAFCCLSLTAALILTACSSGGGGVAADIGAGLADALTAPLDHKDKSLQSLTLDQSVRKNEKLKLAAQGAEKTYGNGDSLNTGKLKNDKVSRFDFIRQIEVDGQLITLESGEFQVYKQDHSAVVALQIEKINNPDKIDSLINQRSFLVSGLGGEHTAFNQLPSGKAEYHGKAFSSDDPNGRLHYSIDFTKKQGYGRIEHLKTPEQNVELASAELKADEKSHAVILGDTRYGGEEKGTYHLALFGDRAQEIAGSATVKIREKVHEIGIAGKQ
ncbi:TPA: factor H binding family protein [Neisseria meningitidis]|nr:factor H binding family protein [Neisseria meningitidis]MCL4998417.1 factor H binding family protein [Neisseria meningitidis]MCL5763416.1 factor H binding family protein [Neisseria meningitidis]MCL5864193.1 factor H binding family protein [Neisseria meningitidis]MCL6137871.1 factor H binding family protein [Neisseria meningitidis]